MSYLTQHAANAFPLWSKVRMDPSSFGYRMLQAMGKADQGTLVDIARFSNVNAGLEGEISALEDPSLYQIDYSEVTTTLAQGLVGLGTVEEDQLFLPESGFVFYAPDGAKKIPILKGLYVYGDETEEEVDITESPTKPDFDYPLPTSYDLQETEYFAALKIWSSDATTAIALGTNPEGEAPTLKAGDGRPPYVGRDALDYQAYTLNDGEIKAYRIGVHISGSTHYKRFGDKNYSESSTISDEDLRDTNIPYSGHHKIVIRGEDITGHPQQEELYIRDDGYEWTIKHFAHVKAVKINDQDLPAIEYDGFNGKVELQVTDIRFASRRCPFFPAVSPDATNGFDEEGIPIQEQEYLHSKFLRDNKGVAFGHTSPLVNEISDATAPITGSYFDSYFMLFVNGQTYKRWGVEQETQEDNRELLASQYLLDDEAEPYTAVDFAYNFYDGRLYILDSTGRVHIYEMGLSDFEEWTFPRTRNLDIEVLPLSHRAMYGEQMPMWTWHRALHAPVKRVTIMRESPKAITETQNASGINEPQFRGEYLQEDFTWSAWDDPDPLKGKHHFSGTTAELPENSWDDIKFWTNFDPAVDPFDVLGQWNFYCETVLKGEQDLELERLEAMHDASTVTDADYYKLKEEILKQENRETFHRASTAVFVEYMVANKTLGTVATPLVDEPYGIFFEGLSDKMCLVKALHGGNFEVRKFKLLAHTFFPWQAGEMQPIVVLKEPYDKVIITTPYSTQEIEVESE